MRRRDFIAGAAGAAAWPSTTIAQQTGRTRQIGLLTPVGSTPLLAEIAAFKGALARFGWTEGRNLRIDEFHVGSAIDRSSYIAELLNRGPDAIVVLGGGSTLAVRERTQTIPIVSVGAGDVFGRIVNNIARPEGNITGVAGGFASLGGKWLELLKEAVPRVERVAYIEAPPSVATNFFPAIADAAKIMGVKAVEIPYLNAVDIVRGIDAFAVEPNAGLIIPPASFAQYGDIILTLAEQHRLPTVAGGRPKEGALISYGANGGDLWRRAAYLVDRLLRGTKVSDLPVEFPTKFELVVNLKTAEAIGVTIPETFLVRADELIE